MRNADENMMFYGEQSNIPYAPRYNKRTGERQFCPYLKCPNYKQKKWYEIGGSPHDEYFLNEVWVKKEFRFNPLEPKNWKEAVTWESTDEEYSDKNSTLRINYNDLTNTIINN